jgi:hypothetical protein
MDTDKDKKKGREMGLATRELKELKEERKKEILTGWAGRENRRI